LIHLIRDLNELILKQPYDGELEGLVKGFADLLKPMVESIDRHGLKSRFLRKHVRSVDRFFLNLSKMSPRSEPAVNLVLAQAEKAFERSAGNGRSEQAALAAKNEQLQAKIVHKNEVIAELMEANVQAKKELGPPQAV
jgi:hypothetical protein